ncbi:MAG: glycosyltransferase family 25 protein [Candidatus Thioglobus sp.]|nr:MAG: glycosyltransferase family 25 protein [Candidatus Thioglobus sp.]
MHPKPSKALAANGIATSNQPRGLASTGRSKNLNKQGSFIPKHPILIINLQRSPDRLEYMRGQLLGVGLDFERIDGVDGANLNEKILEQMQKQSRRSFLHYAVLNAGEIGCAMSWHKVWTQIAEQEAAARIALEDDVELADNFVSCTSKLLAAPIENIIIDLSGKKGFLPVERKTINGIKLVRYQTPPLKNQGQIYGKQACQILLNKAQNFKAPVDTLQQMHWLHNVQTWSLEVGCLRHQDAAVGGSTITTSKKPLIAKLKKELSRPLWRGFIVIRNLNTTGKV